MVNSTSWQRLAVFLLAMLFLGWGMGDVAAQGNDRSVGYQKEARRYLEKGDIKAAIIQLKNAVRADSKNVEARFELGVAELRGGDLPSAEKDLGVARDQGFDEAKLVLPLAEVLLRQQRFQDVIDQIKPGNRGAETESRVLAIRGGAYLGLGKAEEATQALKQSVELKPSARAQLGLARIALSKRDLTAAEAELDRAKALDDKDVEVWLTEVAMRRAQGDLDRALAAANKAVAIDGRQVVALTGRAELHIARNDLPKATADVDAVLKIAESYPPALYLRALIQARQGDAKAAGNTLQGIQDYVRARPYALYLSGVVAYANKQPAQAEAALRQFLTAVPNHVAARKILAAIAMSDNQPERAIEILRPVQGDAAEDLQLLTLFANANLRLRRFEEAASWFEKAAAIKPDDPRLRTGLAFSQLGKGETGQAIEQLDAVLDKDPSISQASALLISTHLRNRNYDKARAVADEIRAQLPNSPLPDYYLGFIESTRGDYAAARGFFEKAVATKADFSPAIFGLGRLDVIEGKLPAARQRFEAELKRHPDSVETILRLADVSVRENRPDEAVTWMERAVKAAPQEVGPRIRLIDFLLQRGEGQKALVAARELITAAPGRPEALDALGRVQLQTGDTANAIGTYRQLVAQTPNLAAAHFRLAGALAASKNEADARRELEQAVAVDPRFVPAQRELIALDLRQQGTDAALKRAAALRKGDPGSALGDVLVGDVQFSAGRYAEAETAYSEGLKKSQVTPIALRVAESQIRRGNPKQAEATMKDWLKNNPRDDDARFFLASLYLGNKQTADSIREHETLLSNSPGNPVILNNLAWLYQEGKDPRALDYAERAHRLAPQAATISDTLGWILVNRGEVKRGVELLRQAATDAPIPEIRYHLAVALAKSGQAGEAKTILDEILKPEVKFDSRGEAEKLRREIN